MNILKIVHKPHIHVYIVLYTLNTNAKVQLIAIVITIAQYYRDSDNTETFDQA